ncbi:MBL fold metallo-hydrolase [Kordiimonas aquimaris]|uniref:MBL fold metallo-hydrolase n=1 Tax=Kordiimonas aquimaris TaxID=707591 RepID=UPI0021D3945B|nr:MBL fold metallo-hydrolase [Kordiimonas aquimaris]
MTPRKVVLLLILVAGISSCSIRPTEYALDDAPSHHTTRGFKNIHVEDPNKTFFSFLRMRMFGGVQWADHTATANLVPYQMLDLDKVRKPAAAPQISWLGHSTFLIQYQGINILTDPIFSDRASALGFTGPKRYTPHTVDYTELPPIDYVVISHNHYDHLNDTAIRVLGSNPKYLIPLGLKEWLMNEGVSETSISELDWWQQANPSFTRGLTHALQIEAQPSQHWSARGIFDRRKTLWASWHINFGDLSIWFAGDTGYNPIQFKEIGEKNGPVDLALIPIGAYDPRDFMQTYHVDPDEAVEIHKDLKARKSIGMHWGTYPLTAEEPMDPIQRLRQARVREDISPSEFGTMKLGATMVLHNPMSSKKVE